MVAHFDFDEPLDEISVADKLNRLLPPDISIYRVCRVGRMRMPVLMRLRELTSIM